MSVLRYNKATSAALGSYPIGKACEWFIHGCANLVAQEMPWFAAAFGPVPDYVQFGLSMAMAGVIMGPLVALIPNIHPQEVPAP